MSYTVIGNDGRTYGPAGEEQIHQWIAQERVESRTPVLVEGAGDWTFLGLLPEFAKEFSGTPPVIAPTQTGATRTRKTNSLATAGLVCGILAWACCCCCVPFNLLGLIFSIIALVQINARPDIQEGRGLAITGLILSATNLLWCLGFTIFNFATNQSNILWSFGQN
jgi:hypothetical protein